MQIKKMLDDKEWESILTMWFNKKMSENQIKNVFKICINLYIWWLLHDYYLNY